MPSRVRIVFLPRIRLCDEYYRQEAEDLTRTGCRGPPSARGSRSSPSTATGGSSSASSSLTLSSDRKTATPSPAVSTSASASQARRLTHEVELRIAGCRTAPFWAAALWCRGDDGAAVRSPLLRPSFRASIAGGPAAAAG